MRRIIALARSTIRVVLKPFVLDIINREIRVWGDPTRLKICPTAAMVNTLFNTSSGNIVVGSFTFTGHGVSLLTGTHDYCASLRERMTEVPGTGRDIIIGKGVWIGSNVTILGPCTIGDHSVIAAGSVVLAGTTVPPLTIVAGIPAKPIKTINLKNPMTPLNAHEDLQK